MTNSEQQLPVPSNNFNIITNFSTKIEQDSLDGKSIYYALNDNNGNKIGCLIRKVEIQQYLGSQSNLVNDVYNLYEYKSVLSFTTNVNGNFGNAKNYIPSYRTSNVSGPLATAGFNKAIIYGKSNGDGEVTLSIALQKNIVKDVKQLPVYMNPLTLTQSLNGNSQYTPFFADKALTTKIGCVETALERINFPVNGLTYFTNVNYYHFYKNASDYGFPVGDFVTKGASEADSQLSVLSNLQVANADQTNNDFVGYQIKTLPQVPDPSSGTFSQLISFGKSYDKSPDVNIEGYFDDNDVVDSSTNPNDIKKIIIWNEPTRKTQLGVAQIRQVTNVYNDSTYIDYQMILEIDKGSGLGEIVVKFTSNRSVVVFPTILSTLKTGSSSLGDSINSTWTNAEVLIARRDNIPFGGKISIRGFA